VSLTIVPLGIDVFDPARPRLLYAKPRRIPDAKPKVRKVKPAAWVLYAKPRQGRTYVVSRFSPDADGRNAAYDHAAAHVRTYGEVTDVIYHGAR
jgi:hypothetical protein